jgi:hypothetical protein
MIQMDRFYMEQALQDLDGRLAAIQRLAGLAKQLLGNEYTAAAADCMNDLADMLGETALRLVVEVPDSVTEALQGVQESLDELKVEWER